MPQIQGQNNLAERTETLTINIWHQITQEKEKKRTLGLIITQVLCQSKKENHKVILIIILPKSALPVILSSTVLLLTQKNLPQEIKQTP